MSLSKKNLDKLNKFKNSKNLNNDTNNISNYTKTDNKDNSTKNKLQIEDPNKIFYTLIDNSESLEETSNVNNSLRKSEINQINMNSKNDNLITNPPNSEDPNKIFYSLIDNSESLEETSNVNNSLRKSEIKQINMNSKKDNFSKKLTNEEELYDEFNYLLDE